MGAQVLDDTRLIQVLIGLVADFGECIAQTACQHKAGHHLESIAIGNDIALQHSRQGIVAGSDYILHLVDDTIDGGDVAVSHRDTRRLIDIDAVRVVTEEHRQLAVRQSGRGNLLVLIGGEGGRLVNHAIPFIVEVTAVDDAVEHNYLHHRIAHLVGGESLPAGCRNQPLGHQTVQILADGLVGGCKAGVIATCREQLHHSGFAVFAYLHLVEQTCILAVVVMFQQVRGNSLHLEYITTAGINLFLTANQQHGRPQ